LTGAIILGLGGDSAPSGWGTFFEGAMTIGYPPDSAENLIQKNLASNESYLLASEICQLFGYVKTFINREFIFSSFSCYRTAVLALHVTF